MLRDTQFSLRWLFTAITMVAIVLDGGLGGFRFLEYVVQIVERDHENQRAAEGSEEGR